MKVQFLTSDCLAPLEGYWRAKFPKEKIISPGELFYSVCDKAYFWWLPEMWSCETGILKFVLLDLVFNCWNANLSLVLISFSRSVKETICQTLNGPEQFLSESEVDFFWVDVVNGERVYRTLRMK